ncbi:MAG: hypothetical protein FJ100_22815 [Deltaproteobacteria bacterium]|nr:hypothetical protein [Deltaproteobacteria bacterium]
MQTVSLTCKSCGAALPQPRGPTVKCEFCEAVMAVLPEGDGGAQSEIASKERPASLFLPQQTPDAELHLYLLKHWTAQPGLDAAFIRSIADARLERFTQRLWCFTAQAKGGFTAMVGVRDGFDVKWQPFSAQLRLSHAFTVGDADANQEAMARSVRLALSINREKVLPDALHGGQAWPGHEPFGLTAAEAWSEMGKQELNEEILRVAQTLAQGDLTKNIQPNVEVAWQPIALGVEVARLRTSRGVYEVAAFDGGLAEASPLPPVEDDNKTSSPKWAEAIAAERAAEGYKALLVVLGWVVVVMSLFVIVGIAQEFYKKSLDVEGGLLIWGVVAALVYFVPYGRIAGVDAAKARRQAIEGEVEEALTVTTARLAELYGADWQSAEAAFATFESRAQA